MNMWSWLYSRADEAAAEEPSIPEEVAEQGEPAAAEEAQTAEAVEQPPEDPAPVKEPEPDPEPVAMPEVRADRDTGKHAHEVAV
jgi:hypothetical protein